MAEPNSSAVFAAGAAVGTVTLTGTFLGMHYDALAIGCAAALFSLLHLPTKDGEARTPLRVFFMVVSAAFFAAIFAPISAQAATEYLPWSAKLGVDVLRMTAAAMIGAGIHVAIPLIFGWMTRKGGAL